MRIFSRLIACVAVLTSVSALAFSQQGQWLTFGHDAQRSGWARDEHAFTPANVAGLHLAWQISLPNLPLSLAGLTAPLVVRNVQTANGPRSLVIVAGSSDHLFAVDAGNGQLVWKADFTAPAAKRAPGMWLCPNNLNDTPVIDAAHERVFVISSDGRLHQLSLRDGSELQPPLRFVPQYSKMWSLNLVHGVLYTTLSQDCAHAPSGVYAMNPDEPGHPVLSFWSNQAAIGGFGGAGIFGRGGVSADFDGHLFAASGDGPWNPRQGQFADTVLKLTPQLELDNYFTPANWSYITRLDLDMGTSTPVIFRWKNRVLEAEGGKEGAVYLNDTDRLGGGDHHTALYISPRYSNDRQTFEQNGIWGGMSAWQDEQGNTWLYVPTWGAAGKNQAAFPLRHGPAPHGAVLAFQVVAGSQGTPRLKPVWRSPDLTVPEPVALAGGVVFALGTGENTMQVHGGDIHQLIRNRTALPSRHAVLVALDAATGRRLWTSGDAMQDWTHFSGIAIGDGKVFAVTHSGTLYAFGLK